MKHRSYVYSFCVFGLLALTLPDASTLLGQEPELFVVDARKYVIESVSDRAKLTLNERSLLNWTNPARQQERGAIYVWEIEGRPLAIGSLFTYEYAGNVFVNYDVSKKDVSIYILVVCLMLSFSDSIPMVKGLP